MTYSNAIIVQCVLFSLANVWKHNFKILMDSVEDYARPRAKRRYSFRMGEECEVANTDYNLKTQWVYEHSLYVNL